MSVQPDLANPIRRRDGGSRKERKEKEIRKRKDQVRSAENRRISPRNIDRFQPEEKTKKNIQY